MEEQWKSRESGFDNILVVDLAPPIADLNVGQWELASLQFGRGQSATGKSVNLQRPRFIDDKFDQRFQFNLGISTGDLFFSSDLQRFLNVDSWI